MPEVPIDGLDAGANDEADQKAVENERAKLQEFIKGLSADDIKSGGWFTKLLAQGLNSYTEKAGFFRVGV
jgi:hypothetical protein